MGSEFINRMLGHLTVSGENKGGAMLLKSGMGEVAALVQGMLLAEGTCSR